MADLWLVRQDTTMHSLIARAPGWRLLFAFFAVVVSFIGATVYTQRAAGDVDVAVVGIVENTAPSIRYLAGARGEARHVEHLLDQYIRARAAGHPADRQAILASRATMDADLGRYLALLAAPREREATAALELAWRAFDALVDRAMAFADAGDLDAARDVQLQGVPSALDRFVAVAMELIELNALEGHELAQQALVARRQTEKVAVVLDVLCVVVSFGAVAAVWRAQRKHTQLLVTNAQLLESRADELESFAGRVAHDVLSPLSGVKLSLELAQRQAGGHGDLKKVLDRGERSLVRATQVVDGLLSFARAGASADPGARVDAAPVLQGVVEEERASAEKVQIDLRLEPFAPTSVACSDGILVSLASNLVRNAIKYMGESAERRVTVRLVERGACVRVEVADTGPGLPPQLGTRAFEPYVRAPGLKQAGMGLGLATVKRLAEGHGGAAGVQSVSGKGCVFWFELPRAPAAAG